MTEVMSETPMKIQEEEIKVQDGFEHLIKILDISEQNVNNMKEWMAFQGFEDILQILGALYRDPDGRMDKYEPYINTEENKPSSPDMWHPTFPCDRIPTKKVPCLTPTLMDKGQARSPNTTYNGYKMEFWKFALTWKIICPVQHKITQKRAKRNHQRRKNILNHNGPKVNLQLNT